MLSMRLAISYWQNYISPVFDFSENMLLIDIINDQITHSETTSLDSNMPFGRAQILSDWGVDVLICGAISQTSRMVIAAKDIRIISYLFGSWEDALVSFINGQLDDGYDDFMPEYKNGRYRKRHQNRSR